MQVLIIGTESMGVRGLCCLVYSGSRRYLIDPGVALGYLRGGLLPHPCQIAVGDAVRARIIAGFLEATDIVISHYHGDHVPLLDANPYQLPLESVPKVDGIDIWSKGISGLSPLSLKRRQDLIDRIGWNLVTAEGLTRQGIGFSGPVPHGSSGSGTGSVMMTCIRDGDETFVHASDIQMLNREAVEKIKEWMPDVVIASGPPLYLDRLTKEDVRDAWNNAVEIASMTGILILDHHLLRSKEGFLWLKRLSAETGGNVISGSDFMGIPEYIPEAERDELYRKIPVPDGWHDAYARGETGFWDFVDKRVRQEIDLIRQQHPVTISAIR